MRTAHRCVRGSSSRGCNPRKSHSRRATQYRFDTSNGAVEQIKVGAEPHGLTVWPQPGRYSLGHTGNLR